MDKLTHGIQELESFQKDIETTYDKVKDQEPEDINFNDVSFDVRNSGRLSSYIGKNTSKATSEEILKVISSGKEPDKKKEDVLKFLDSIRTSLARNLQNYRSLSERLDKVYGDDVGDKLGNYEDDVDKFEQDLLHIYRSLADSDNDEIPLGNLASDILDAGTKHNEITKQMGQSTVSDINNLMQNHYKEYVKSYVLDYLLTMVGRVGFDAKDKGELNRELTVSSTGKAETK